MFAALCRLLVAALVLIVPLAASARAENEGREDLDRATEAQQSAKTVNDLSEVIRLLDSALTKGLDQGNTEFAQNLLASTLIQRGTTLTEIILKVSPPDPRWPQLRKLALADLEKALTLRPKQPQAMFNIARLNLLPAGDAKRAAEALGQTIELTAEEPPLRAQALLLRATDVETDPVKRLADLDEAARLVPAASEPLRARGLVLADQGKLPEALADLDKAIELAPKQVSNFEAKVAVLAKFKKFDEAILCLDKVRELMPQSPLPLIQKARIRIQQEDLEAALRELNQAESLDEDNLEVLLVRAGVYEEMGQKDKALLDVDKMLKIRPNFPSALWLRGALLSSMGKHEEALAEIEKLHGQHPEDPVVLLQVGMFYVAEKAFDRAIEVYSKILGAQPENPLALRGRGDALLNLGKHEEALADYEKALKLESKDSGLLNNLAWVLATSPIDKLRDGKRAIQLATQACELTEFKQAHILSTLGAAYAETGDFPTAIKWLEKALEIPKSEHKEELRKELESYRAGKPWREMLVEKPGDKKTGPATPEVKEPEIREPEAKEPEPKEPEIREPDIKAPQPSVPGTML